MRLPHMRFSVRRMLVAVAVVAIMFHAAKYIYDNQPRYIWERWLVGADASQWQTAAQELGLMGPEALGSVPALVEALRIDLDAAVRKQAAISLYMVLARNGEDGARGNAVLALIEAQRDRDPAVRAAAAVALSVLRADPEVTGHALLRAVKDGDGWSRGEAVSALAYNLPNQWAWRTDVHRSILVALRDADPHVRELAMNSLLVLSERDPSILETGLKHEDVQLRRGTAYALCRGGLRAGAAYSALFAALDDSDAEVRRASAEALSDAVPGPDSKVPQMLINALRDRNAAVRKTAVIALGKFGARASRALPALLESQRDADAEIRLIATQVATRITTELNEEDTNLLTWIEMLRAVEPSTRGQAADALKRMGPAAAKALPILVKMTSDDPDEEVRESATRASEAIAKPN